MTDSTKLRLVYGILSMVASFLLFGGALSISFLIGFSKLPSTPFLFIAIVMFIFNIILACLSAGYFFKAGHYQAIDEVDYYNN